MRQITVTTSPAVPYAQKQVWRVEETPYGLKLKESTLYQGEPGTPWYTDPACLEQDSRMELFGDTPEEGLRLALAFFDGEKAEHQLQVRRAENRCQSVPALQRERLQK